MDLIILETLLALLLAGASFIARAEIFWYDPLNRSGMGGMPINCDIGGDCVHLGTGDLTAEWYVRALACPLEFPRRTEFVISGSWRGLADGEWTCLDAGGAVVIRKNGVIVLDLLSEYPVWQEQLEVEIRLP